jgi:hypothetical protein
MKQCIKCLAELGEASFTKNKKMCDICIANKKKEYNQKYYIDNKDKLLKQAIQYYENNKQDILAQAHEKYVQNKNTILTENKRRYVLNKEKYNKSKRVYYKNNATKFKKLAKEYRENNKELAKKWSKEWEDRRKKNDPSYKLRKNITRLVSYHLFKSGNSKNRISILSRLEYSFDDLKIHLESQFEPWMTWDNYGKYNAKIWNNSDSATWTWQLDHIVPQTKLPYLSMTDENFKKCWALSNLRPLSAKQNVIEGAR